MLILAGVSLNAIVGDNGILTQAQNAKIEAENASIKETVDQILVEAYAKEFDSQEDFVTWVNEKIAEKGLSDSARLQLADEGYVLTYGKGKRTIEYLTEDLGQGGNLVAVEGSSEEWDYVTQEGTLKVKLVAYKGSETSVTIPNIVDGKIVSAIGGNIFGEDSNGNGRNVQEVNFSDGLIEIDSQSFMGNTNLTTLGSFPSSLKKIGDAAFYNCSNMEAEVSNILKTTISYGSNVYKGCTKITGDIGIAMSVLIKETDTKIPDYLFSGMSGLTGTITIGRNIEEVGEHAFDGCSNVTGIDISNSDMLNKIGYRAFYNTINMTGSLAFKDGITIIEKEAFFYAGYAEGKNLTDLLLPSSLKTVGFQCFSRSGVTSVCFDCRKSSR